MLYLRLKRPARYVAVLHGMLDLFTQYNWRGTVLRCSSKALQSRLDGSKVDADTCDGSGSPSDFVNGFGEELGTLESSHGNAHNGGSDAEGIHGNENSDFQPEQ
jgi:hypothetical protein